MHSGRMSSAAVYLNKAKKAAAAAGMAVANYFGENEVDYANKNEDSNKNENKTHGSNADYNLTSKTHETHKPAAEGEIIYINSFTPHQLIKAYSSLGLVGEENNAVLQTIAAVHGMSFGIEGPSGSGKSHLANLLIELLPRGSVYSMELSSKTAEMYNCDEINLARMIYVPELQKALKGNPMMMEIIKNLTEGRDAVRKVRCGNETLEQKITGDKSVIYTFATENLAKKDAEMARRFFVLSTDVSEEQTRKIMEHLAMGQYGINACRRSKIVDEAKQHIADCINLDARYGNPFAQYLASIMPQTLDMRSKVKHYFGLLNAHARFSFKERVKVKDCLLLSIDDVFAVNKMYETYMIGKKGEMILEKFDYKQCLRAGVDKLRELNHCVFEKWYPMQGLKL